MAQEKPDKKVKYWYEFYHEECVLCGRGDDYKIRRYTPKPKEWMERHHYEQFACDGHFM